MENQIADLFAHKIIEKDGEEYIFITTLKIGIAEDENGDLQIIDSFRLTKDGEWVGRTADGKLIEVEGNLQIYSLGF